MRAKLLAASSRRLSTALRSGSGYKNSLEWVKAGCPSLAEPAATPTTALPLNEFTQASNLIGEKVAAVGGIATAQTPIPAIMLSCLAALAVLNLQYETNEYEQPSSNNEEASIEAGPRYGGAFDLKDKGEDDEAPSFEGARYGGVFEPKAEKDDEE